FDRAIAADPKSADPRTGLGFVALRRKTPRPAETAFREALAIDPSAADAWKGLGLALRDQEEIQPARGARAKPTERTPPAAEARRRLERGPAPGPPARKTRPRRPVPAGVPLAMPSRCGPGRFEIRTELGFRPFFIKGVNLGTALPGK